MGDGVSTEKLRRVVIADDDPDIRMVLGHLMQTLDVEVVEVESGGDLAMLLMDGGPLDLLITDVKMPWATGIQVSTAARNAGMVMPVIVITGVSDDRVREAVHHIGPATLLPKPFNPDDLISLARSFLDG
jgi:DNA-binding NtrC family response regulator